MTSSLKTSKTRSKACINCRKSKVKCIKDENESTCKRCKVQGIACVYEYKVLSYKVAQQSQQSQQSQHNQQVNEKSKLDNNSLQNNSQLHHISRLLNPVNIAPSPSAIPQITNNNNNNNNNNKLNNKLPFISSNNTNSSILKKSLPIKSIDNSSLIKKSENILKTDVIPIKELNKWENSVEDRLDSFGSTLNTIVSLLQNKRKTDYDSDNNEDLRHNHNKRHKFENEGESETENGNNRPNMIKKTPEISNSSSIEKFDKFTNYETDNPVELLKKILSIEDSKELFKFFNKNISPQLFGFDISKYSVIDIWNSCPLLIATICCISSIHHPFLSHLSTYLEKIIYDISKIILFNIPKNEIEAFNTIMALCFCGFWFKNDQLFTGLAIQLAKTMNLISPINNNKSSCIPKKDRLKLWYLLYILDGQQSLVFNRQSMFNSNDKIFENSKELLIDANNEYNLNDSNEKIDKNEIIDKLDANYADFRLISQVEYHHAINAVFVGNAWDLLTPASFGLPFKTNLELDKWMVQWTVLLNPFNNHPIWSSKSTLIYYNFAKMHINSSAVRSYHCNGINLPKFNEFFNDFEINEDLKNSKNSFVAKEIEELDTKKKNTNSNNDEDDDDEGEEGEDEDFNIMKEMSPFESRKVSAELALSAAETVLNIVLNDDDILSVLKYVPIHIHIMLYYSALLILKKHGLTEDEIFDNSISSIKLVKRLKYSIMINTPTDKQFSNKIVEGLNNILSEKIVQMKDELKKDTLMSEDKRNDRFKTLDDVLLDDDSRQLFDHHRRRARKISAWPGFDAGHPSKRQ